VRDNDPPTVLDNLPVVVHEVPDAADAVPELIAEVAASMLEGLAAARHRLAAELVLASMFGTLAEGLPQEMGEAERAAAVTALLSALIEHCERLSSSDGLAFLRLAAQQGPAPCRRNAHDAVERLVGRGVRERPRASSTVSLSVVRAWRYGDVFGEQSSIGILFAYGHREHALSVLIDHALGGGIKDAWIAEGRDARGLRDHVADTMAVEPTALFEDITEHQALDGLRAALGSPPCPEQPDQIEDVGNHLYLVHKRAQQLATRLEQPDVELFAN
jgi:hypothetical protein